MGRCRVVAPVTTRVALTDGDWIDLKRRLNIGEQRAAFAAVYGEILPSGARRPNIEMAGMSQVLAYIVDWSFEDAQGKRLPCDTEARKLAAVNSLDTETYQEIDTAVAAHIEAMERADTEAKKPQDGASAS